MSKFKYSYEFYGNDTPLTSFGKVTGVYGLYCKQSIYMWFGIKGLFGLSISKRWAHDF